MKKIYLILFLSISMVLCLFGCNASVEQGNDDSNDTQVKDQNNDAGSSEVGTEEPDPVEIIVEKPVIQEVYIHCEKDALADIFVESLYNYIIDAQPEDWLYRAETVKASDLSMSEVKAFAYCVGKDIYGYNRNRPYSGTFYDLDDLIITVEMVLGSGFEVGTEEWVADGKVFVYEEDKGTFAGEPAFGDDYPAGQIVGYFGKYEIDGDYLYIYDRVLFCDHDRWGTGIIKFYSDINKTEDSYVNEFQVGSYLPQAFSNDEALEQYGAEYKHTFKLAEDGSGYYWVSSEPVK